MRLRGLHLDGFGHFHGRRFDGLDAPVTVLLGANEAGKTTLLAFLRAVLFGFPTYRRDSHYPPLDGGRHGGSVLLLDETGGEHTVERYAGAKGGVVTVTGADGTVRGESGLRALLGHVSRGLFEKVFTFGLDELYELDALQGEEVRGRIYSAGFGVPNLPTAERTLRQRQDALFQPRGSSQEISRIARELEEVDGGLRRHADDAAEYARLTAKAKRLQEDAQSLENERTQLAERLSHVERLRQGWDDLVAYGLATGCLAALPTEPSFPHEALPRLEAHLEKVQEAEDRLAREEQADATARKAAQRPLEGAAVLEDELHIDQAVERRGSVADSIHDLPERVGELHEKREQLHRSLESMGSGWEASRVQSFDTSLPVRDEVTQHLEALTQRQRTLDDARQTTELAEQESSNARQAEAQAIQEMEAAPRPALDETEVESRQSAGRRARQAMETREQEAGRRADLEEQVEALNLSRPSGARASRPWWLVALLAAGAAAIVVGGLTGEVSPLFAVLAVILFLIGATGAFIVSSRHQPAAVPVDPGFLAQLRLARLREADAGERLSAAAQELGLPAVDQPDLDRVEQELKVMTEQHSRLRELAREVDRASHERSRRDGGVETGQKKLVQATDALKDTQAAWRVWLEARGLPPSLSPQGAQALLGLVQTVRTEIDVVDALHQRVEAIRQDIREAADLVLPLARRHGAEADVDRPATLPSAIDALRHMLSTAREEATTRRYEAKALKDAEAELDGVRRALAQRHQELRDLLTSGGTDDQEEFRRRAAIATERETLTADAQARLNAMKARFGPSADVESLQKEIQSLDPDALGAQAHELNKRLSEHDQGITVLREDRGRALTELEGLSDEQEASDLRTRREMLLEGLREAADRWSAFTLARALIQKGRARYERERKPAVVQEAERFFVQITDGRYTGLDAPLDAETLGVRLASGARKEITQLSRATREQLHLALRFGVVRDFNRQDTCLPLVVDDALVNFDPARARATAQAFTELAETNQVLVFTCHPHLAEMFASVSPDTQVIEVSRTARAADGP